MKRRNCSGKGWSSPSCAASAARSASVVSCPSMLLIGSPMNRNIENDTKPTISSTSTDWPIRVRTNAIIAFPEGPAAGRLGPAAGHPSLYDRYVLGVEIVRRIDRDVEAVVHRPRQRLRMDRD